MFNMHFKRGYIIVESSEYGDIEYVSYKAEDIHHIKFEFFNEEEADSGFIEVVLNKDVDEEDEEYDYLFTGFLLADHSNQFEWNEYEEMDLLCDAIVRIARICAGHKIDLRLPDIGNTPLGDFLEKYEQQKVEQWWKDDFIFRHIFSRN